MYLFPLILNKNHALVAADLPNKEEKESNPHPTMSGVGGVGVRPL